MRNRRWSGENDRHFWPFTLCTGDYKRWGVMLDSGARDDGEGDCHIRFHFRRTTIICELPRLVSDYCIRHEANWDAATVARIGRNWYYERHSREYGFTISEGSVHVHYGPQTHSSTTTKVKVYWIPWRDWRHIRTSLYDKQGEHFWTEYSKDRTAWAASSAVKDACPKVQFEFDDFDGERITATTHIEEREWRLGTRSFRWLSLFRRPKVSRSLSLDFSKEVGPEKGSWKGGTLGHGIEMLPGELHEDAFKRYCQEQHRSKYRRFEIKFVGRVPDPPVPTDPQAAAGAA